MKSETGVRPAANPKGWRNHATRVLVLGASGRLGRALCDRVRVKGHSRPMEFIWQFRSPKDGGTAIPGRVLDWDMLKGNMPAHVRADIVLCLAGAVPGRADDLDFNVALARCALHAGLHMSARHVFLPSSAAVYGNGGFSEQSHPAPLDIYGVAKLRMEQMAAAWGATTGSHAPGVTCLRIGNVAGADRLLGPGQRHVSLDSGPKGEAIRRSYIGPNRLSDMLLDLCQMAASGVLMPPVLNLALSPSVACRGLLQAAGWSFSEISGSGSGPVDVDLDTRLASKLGLKPEHRVSPEDIWADLNGGVVV